MSKLNIAWLSDIHFMEGYADGTNSPWVEAQCRDTINHLTEKHPELDYLVLNGDIAFKGSAQEYELFSHLFLKKIKVAYPSLKILSVPGNHDVDWKSAKFLIESLKKTDMPTYDVRTGLLKKGKMSEFEKPFENYKGFITENGINSCEGKMHESGLYGWQVDHANKIVFVLLNSAWYSIGPLFDDLIAEFCDEKKMNIGEALKIKSGIAEFGNQVIGNELMFDFFFKMTTPFSDYPAYTFITIMHHPIHWLSWYETYGLTQTAQESKTLYRILKKSSFLLTGHEHIPGHVPHQQMFKDVYHLQAGCFLEERTTGDISSTQHNRFSVLQIHKNKVSSLNEFRYSITYDYIEPDYSVPIIPIIDRNSASHETNSEIRFANKILAPYKREGGSKAGLDREKQKIETIHLVCNGSLRDEPRRSKSKNCFRVYSGRDGNQCDIFLFDTEDRIDSDDITIAPHLHTDVNTKLIAKIDELAYHELVEKEKSRVEIHIIDFDYADESYFKSVSNIVDFGIDNDRVLIKSEVQQDLSRQKREPSFKPRTPQEIAGVDEIIYDTSEKRKIARQEKFDMCKKRRYMQFNKFKHDYFIRAEDINKVEAVPEAATSLKITPEYLSRIYIVLHVVKYWELGRYSYI